MTTPYASSRATHRPNLKSQMWNANGSDRISHRSTSLLGALVLLVLFSSSAIAQYGGGPAKLTIKSSVLGEDRTILVRTPPGYETNKLAYPVLYMTDGDAHIAHTSSTIEFLSRNGRMSEMIVVGITNTDRTRDLTPTKGIGPNAAQFPTAGGSDNFLKFIETEVMPEIEKRYRTAFWPDTRWVVSSQSMR